MRTTFNPILLTLLTLALLLGLASTSLADTGRCTTTENTILNSLETICDDGSRAISRWDSLLQRWETIVQPAPGTKQSCQGRVNPLTRQIEVRCR